MRPQKGQNNLLHVMEKIRSRINFSYSQALSTTLGMRTSRQDTSRVCLGFLGTPSAQAFAVWGNVCLCCSLGRLSLCFPFISGSA